MSITGYSDRINHALAFAAKHHDRQVRKGTRLPYLTHPANVAIILTRYGRDECTVVAGILHDVIEDCVREAYTREMLEQRIGEKFGRDVLDTVLDGDVSPASTTTASSSRTTSAATTTSSAWRLRATRRAGCARPTSCTTRAASSPICGEPSSPTRSGAGSPAARTARVRWYRRVYDRLNEVGFTGEIMGELEAAIAGSTRIEDPAPQTA